MPDYPSCCTARFFKLTQVYEQFGQCFPKVRTVQRRFGARESLLCPPNVVNSAMSNLEYPDG